MANDITRLRRRDALRAMAACTGLIWSLAGAMLLACAACLPLWPDSPGAAAFLLPAAALLGPGGGLWLACRRPSPPPLSLLDGGVIVLAGWAGCCLAGAWPFHLALGLDFTRSVFEAVSGFTTTGLSVLDVERAPRAILLWRSGMQLAGGAGLAIIMLAALAGPPRAGLSGAEGRADQLAPHVRTSARLVLAFCGGYAALGTLAYRWAGMDWFDAVNHAFAAVSTGGFSTRAGSIGAFDAPAVAWVSLPLMFLGGLNFVTARLLAAGRLRDVARNSELRCFLLLLGLGTALLALAGGAPTAGADGHGLRTALFEAMSALTTTGFSSVDTPRWSALGVHVLLLGMLVGGGTGSTAGGLKQYRFVLLARSIWWELRRMVMPRRTVHQPAIYMGRERRFVTDADLRRAGAFLSLYLGVLAVGAGILAAHGYPLDQSLFEFASAQGTVGLSLGITSAAAPDGVLWAEALGMFMGRLEFFIVFAGLARGWALLRRPLNGA
ncbi:MAG: TrkH family potassium uptake protein [Desulfovibrionaceae bacterium]